MWYRSFIRWTNSRRHLRVQCRRVKSGLTEENARFPSRGLAGYCNWPCGLLVIAVLLFGPSLATAQVTLTDQSGADSQKAVGTTPSDGQMCPLHRGSLLQVTLSRPLRWSEWRPGSLIEGQFSRPVYSGGQIVIPSKSRLILEIDHVTTERVKGGQVQGWRAKISNSFRSLARRGNSHSVAFRSAKALIPSGAETQLHVSLASVGERIPARTRAKKTSPDPNADLEMEVKAPASPGRHSQLIVRLEEQAYFPVSLSESSFRINAPTERTKIPAGAQARLLLLTELSATRNHAGDCFQAQLMEPIWLDGRIGVPEGSLFEGRITKRLAPRCLNRGGSLHLDFHRLILPSGSTAEISASLNGAESDIAARLSLDSEGGLSAGRQGKVALLINLGTSWLVGKVVDDLIEEGIKWGASAVTSATAATIARYFGIGTGVALMVLQHGKDARLPPFAELQVTFNRPIFLDPSDLNPKIGPREEPHKTKSQEQEAAVPGTASPD